MIYIKIYIAMFFICWFVFYGIEFAYWRNKNGLSGQYYEDMSDSIFLSLLTAIIWPVGWILQIKSLGYGFKIK